MAPICHNPELEARLVQVVNSWGGNPGAVLRLFRNDLVPDPDTEPGAFMECNYVGYGAVPLSGELSAPVKLSLGLWQSQSNLYTFPSPGAGAGNNVHGLYVTLNGTVRASLRFAAPFEMTVGGSPLKVRLYVRVSSASIYLLGV